MVNPLRRYTWAPKFTAARDVNGPLTVVESNTTVDVGLADKTLSIVLLKFISHFNEISSR